MNVSFVSYIPCFFEYFVRLRGALVFNHTNSFDEQVVALKLNIQPYSRFDEPNRALQRISIPKLQSQVLHWSFRLIAVWRVHCQRLLYTVPIRTYLPKYLIPHTYFLYTAIRLKLNCSICEGNLVVEMLCSRLNNGKIFHTVSSLESDLDQRTGSREWQRFCKYSTLENYW